MKPSPVKPRTIAKSQPIHLATRASHLLPSLNSHLYLRKKQDG